LNQQKVKIQLTEVDKIFMPHVSIGMPVYNGEKYIEPALNSILNQTFADFELIISDNASNDKTQEICKEYASNDKRVSYFRNEDNVGAIKNFNFVFKISSGNYFKWAAHDDIIAPNFLSRCVDKLDHDPSIVLCHSKVKLIDEDGKPRCDSDILLSNIESKKPHARFRDLVLINHWCFHIFGLIRSNVLKETKLLSYYPGSDKILLAQLALRGRFYDIPEYLFFSREHGDRSIRALPLIYVQSAWYDPSNEMSNFPHWRLFKEYLKSPTATPRLKWRDQAMCYLYAICWIFANFNWAWLTIDFIVALIPRSWVVFWRLKQTKQRYTGTRTYGHR
jgi:glycosyltransferase involved in cell wall biosynthesis